MLSVVENLNSAKLKNGEIFCSSANDFAGAKSKKVRMLAKKMILGKSEEVRLSDPPKPHLKFGKILIPINRLRKSLLGKK